MAHLRLMTLLRVFGLVAGLIHGAQPAPAAELDAKRDPRLAKKLLLRSEGFPISRVLQRLSAQSGVTLSAVSGIGDERLIAFVPEAPLAEILNAIADLHRLEWTRGAGDRPGYRLIKTPGAARDEANLRKRCIEEALKGIAQQITAREAATAVPQDPSDANRYALTQFALRRTRQNWDRLLRDGTVTIPVRSLPANEREALVSHLQPYLDTENASQHEERRALIQQLRSRGVEPKDLLSPSNAIGTPAAASHCTLSLELRVHEGVELTAGLRDGKTTQYRTYILFRSKLEPLRDAGMSLYADRPFRPGPGTPQVLRADPTDTFALPLKSLPAEPETETWWLRLQAVAEASGQAIYADDYPQRAYGRGVNAAGGRQGDSLTRALDRLVGTVKGNEWSSFWWRRGNAALVRSRAWLWESETVLAADFSERLAATLQRTGDTERFDARALPLLASLPLRQAQAIFAFPGALDAWRYAVVVAARFGPASRDRLCREGLSWEALTPAEQKLLTGIEPPPLAGAGPRYEAYIGGGVHRADHDSGEALHLTLRGSWGTDNVHGSVVIPLSHRNRHGLLVLDSARIDRKGPPPSRLVGALYYPWYGTPGVSGAYRHYRDVSAADQRIANLAHYPVTGPYDSTDETTLRRHLRQAREAGIDLLVCSWWGSGSFEHRAIEKLVRLAEGSGVHICLFVEPYRGLAEARTPAMIAQELGPAVNALSAQPAYLKVAGKPVVFLYHKARELHETQSWADALALMEKDGASGLFPMTESIHPADALVFGGLRLGYFEETSRHTPSNAEALRARRRLVIGTVSPGMDLRHALRDPKAWMDRLNGNFYGGQWTEALADRPDWVLINSFNHWEIGSEIEPSTQFGDHYLKLTAQHVERFKAGAKLERLHHPLSGLRPPNTASSIHLK